MKGIRFYLMLQWQTKNGFFNHFFLLSKLEWVLGTGDQDETIAEVGNVVLKRKDFWTLGLNEQLEATVS